MDDITKIICIYDIFNFALAFKGYLRSCIKEHEEDIEINKIKRIVKEYDVFLSDPFLNVIKSTNFNAPLDLGTIIIDHYKLLGINLNPEEMDVESIENYLKALEVIINSYYLEKYDLSIDIINDLFDAKKIMEANKE